MPYLYHIGRRVESHGESAREDVQIDDNTATAIRRDAPAKGRHGYAKPMFIKPHHRPIYPHIFADVRKPLVPKKLSRPIGELTTLVHPLVTRYPRVAALSRRWSPEHITVTPQQALPGVTIATEAPLGAAVFVERHDGDTVTLKAEPTSWMVNRLIGNFHAELPRHSRDIVTALLATGHFPADMFTRKAKILERALLGVPSFLLQVPAALSADEASDRIVEHLLQALDQSAAA